MSVFAAWMVLREKPLAAKKSDSEVNILIFVSLLQHLQKLCQHFLCLRGFVNKQFCGFYVVDLEYFLWWPLRHFADGLVLDVYRLCVQ